jgi:endonuclease/exonuclease/phosphatase family metal-dependent hydrolase
MVLLLHALKIQLLAVLLLALSSSATFAGPEEHGRPLRVVTYNLLHGGPASGFMGDETHLEARLEMAIRELAALEPDIVALQEASQSRRHGNVPERIARHLGMHVIFAPATERLFGVWPLDQLIVGLMGFKEGSAILSRFPFVTSEVYDLPRCQRWLDPRILLRAEVSTPWGTLQIFSTHTARGDECQIRRVGELVREHRGTGPSLLMGDFNTLETSRVVMAPREEASFVDAFRSANPDATGATVWQRIEVKERTASKRVDFIFVLNGLDAMTGVRSSRVVLDQPGRLSNEAPLWPSDHYGVFAEIEISPNPEIVLWKTREKDQAPVAAY